MPRSDYGDGHNRDAFMARPSGGNGAGIDPLRRGQRHVGVYVDDDRSSCSSDSVNSDGPRGDGSFCDFTR